MARYRTVINLGITLGTVPAGIALAGGDAFGALLAANAVSYLAAAAIVATLPRTAPRARVRTRLLVPSPPTAALIGVDGLMSMWVVVLNVGLPLWILQATPAAPALVAVLYAVNTVLAVLFQTRASRLVRTTPTPRRPSARPASCSRACCACLAGSAVGSRELSTLLLVAAVLCLTAGELLKASAAWQITFTLAPSARAAEFFATYGLGRVAAQIGGPVLVTCGRARAGERGLAAARRGVRGRRRGLAAAGACGPRATGRRAQAASRAAALHAAARACLTRPTGRRRGR